MAQDGGVDPHGIAAAHGFRVRFRGRPESSCVLEVPARLERAITDLQSVALASLAMEPCGSSDGTRTRDLLRDRQAYSPTTPRNCIGQTVRKRTFNSERAKMGPWSKVSEGKCISKASTCCIRKGMASRPARNPSTRQSMERA